MKKRLTDIKIFLLSIFLVSAIISCKDELTGTLTEISPPSTQIINVPPENSMQNPYSPILTLHWKGISESRIIRGFYVSYKSYYMFKNDSVITEPYFVSDNFKTIAFPSADSINKQVVIVKAVDKNNVIDPIGDTKTFYTKITYSPVTEIIFPADSMTFYRIDETTPTWEGVKITFNAESQTGEIVGYSVKIDDGEWSSWQTDTLFYINNKTVGFLPDGFHKVTVKSRNSAFVEDTNPPEIIINLVTPSHNLNWIIIDNTKDQNGTIEHPSDEQVDLFYDSLFNNIPHDNWDIQQQGLIPKNELGKYKYVMWHCDTKAENSLPSSVGLLTDYLNTGGRLLISGWDFYDKFSPTGVWRDSIKYFGNFLQDFLHINYQYTATEALLDSVIILDENYSQQGIFAIDTNKIWSFRAGLFNINIFTNLGAFTNSLFLYHPANADGEDYVNGIIGFGYHNAQYQLVVSGFPFYYLTNEGGKNTFLRAKEFIEKDFPY